jgi:hypothetical protein
MQRVIERLEQDHRMLASTLVQLERAVDHAAQGVRFVGDTIDGLSLQVREHGRREGELATACGAALRRLRPSQLDCLALDHGHERRVIWMLSHRCRDGSTGVAEIAGDCRALARTLRSVMLAQEAQLFPMVQSALDVSLVPSLDELERAVRPLVVDTMTVQQVLQDCPPTRTVFDGWMIPIEAVRREPLDEVAWYYGVDLEELLAQLERVMAGPVASRGLRREPEHEVGSAVGVGPRPTW